MGCITSTESTDRGLPPNGDGRALSGGASPAGAHGRRHGDVVLVTDDPGVVSDGADNPIYCELDHIYTEANAYTSLEETEGERYTPMNTKASNPSTSSTLSDHLTCLICKSRYHNPKILPCFHSFCLTCLENKKSDGIVACPECDSKHSLPHEGASSLPDCPISTALLSKESESESCYEIYVDRFLKCPKCKKEYTEPKILPCFHSFCISCIEELVTDDRIVCFVCDSKHNLPAEGLTSLPDCTVLSSSSNKDRSVPSRDEEEDIPVVCGGCAKENSRHFCFDCSLALCEDCSGTHANIPATQTHQVVPLAEYTKTILSEKPVACQTHSDHWIVSYCLSCRVSVCSLCMNGEHKGPGHKLVTFTELMETEQMQLLGKLDAVRSKAGALHNLSRDYHYHDGDADERYKHEEQKLAVGFQQLTQLLTNALQYVEAEKEAVMYDIKLEYNMEKSMNDDRNRQVQTSLNEARFCLEAGAHLVVQKDSVAFVSNIGQTMENIELLLGTDIAPPLSTRKNVTPQEKLKTTIDTAYSILQVLPNLSENSNA